MINVLLIGGGTMGSVHAESYNQMETVNLVGVIDTQKEVAEKIASMYDVKAFYTFEDAEQVLDRVDVIDVCLPTNFHEEYVKKAADAGKHVICEKPLARHLESGRSMIDYCEQKGVKLFVGHVVRFFPEYKKIKSAIEDRRLGDIAVVRTTRGGAFPKGSQDWYSNFNRSGGLILDLIIHDFDYLRWCFGEVERVYAKSLLGRTTSRLDYALVTLRFESGVIAHVEGTWAHEGFFSKIEVAGKQGVIDYDSSKVSPVKSIIRDQEHTSNGVEVPESPTVDNPYFLELEHFMECIEHNRDPIVTPHDAYKATEIALAAIESIQTGQPVTLKNASRDRVEEESK